MSRGVNKVILVGNLGQKPEMRYTATQTAVANLSIATTESWKDKESGENRDKTEWHKVVFFGNLAEIAEKYLDKGSSVLIFSGKVTIVKVAIGFVIFRILDILKPWPVSYWDQDKTEVSVVADDLLAGVISGVIISFI